MPAQLVALNDGPSILLDKPILLLGRHPECDVQIDSRKISRRHCCIAQVEDYLVVRDLDSTNGIRINGVRVVEGRLNPGDELSIGSHRYQVVWDEVPSPQPPPRVSEPAARAAAGPRGEPIDDDLLESADQPVALPESPRPRPRTPAPAQGPPPAAPAPRPTPPPPAESLILPDSIELLPNSGSYPAPPNPPPAAKDPLP
jgi:predicted component of type VI protein secretion system